MSPLPLPVRTRETLAADGSRRRSLSVFCPRRETSVDLGVCEDCPHVESVSRTFVACTPVAGEGPLDADVLAGARSSVGYLCARSDVPVRALIDVAPEEPWAVPIVDATDAFLGFAYPREAVAALPPRLAMALPIGQVLFGGGLAISEGSPVRWAIHAMVRHRGRLVALLDDAGKLRGVLTDIDALRALRR